MRGFRVYDLKCRGMTLIELMISVAIMAVIASGAFKVYSNLQSAHERIDQKTDQLDSLQRFWQLFRQDTAYATYRKIRVSQEQFGPEDQGLFDASPESVAGEFSVVQWSRSAGLPNIMLKTPQSELRRVAYGLDKQKLYRFQWDQMDPAPDSQPQSVLVLDNVVQLSLRFGYIQLDPVNEDSNAAADPNVSNSGSAPSDEKKTWQWSTQWPLPADSLNSYDGDQSNEVGQVGADKTLLPSVVELTLQLDGFGTMTRLFEFGAPDAGAWQSRKDKQMQQPAPSGKPVPNGQVQEESDDA